MSQADELLNSLAVGESTGTGIAGDDDARIIIGSDRVLYVPEELRRVAVQYDHNAEIITFDCPRYWDDIDLCDTTIYINYMRPDGLLGSSIAENVTANPNDSSLVQFTWTIDNHISEIEGKLKVVVCAKIVDDNGNEVSHWNSELCDDFYVSEGLECEESIQTAYPSIFTQIVTRMNATSEAMQGFVNTYYSNNPLEVMKVLEDICTFATNNDIDHIIDETYVDCDEISIFDESYIASNDDIDKILAGKWVDIPDGESFTNESITEEQLNEIINNAF